MIRFAPLKIQHFRLFFSTNDSCGLIRPQLSKLNTNPSKKSFHFLYAKHFKQLSSRNFSRAHLSENQGVHTIFADDNNNDVLNIFHPRKTNTNCEQKSVRTKRVTYTINVIPGGKCVWKYKCDQMNLQLLGVCSGNGFHNSYVFHSSTHLI